MGAKGSKADGDRVAPSAAEAADGGEGATPKPGSSTTDRSASLNGSQQLAASLGKPVNRTEMIDIADAEDDGDGASDETPPDPKFWLGAATTIGMACFCTFIFSFITSYGALSGPPVWMGTFIGGGIAWLAAFVYYAVTSQVPLCCYKMRDGLFGSFPYLFIGMGVCYVYVVLGLSVAGVAPKSAPTKDKILMFICVPFYMLVWLPLFVFLLWLQASDLDDVEKAKADEKKKKSAKIGKRPWMVSVVLLRRCVIGFVVSCCLASYADLPLFALAWLCVGFYLAWEIHIAIPLSVIGATVAFVALCAWRCPKVVVVPAKLAAQYFALPILGWSPRLHASGWASFVPRYDNSFTAVRHLEVHNAKVEEARKAEKKGDVDGANRLYAEAKAERRQLEAAGAAVVVTVEDVE